MENKKIRSGIESFLELVNSTNQYINETQVWNLAKNNLDDARLIFANLLQNLEVITRISEVLLPESSIKMKTMLGNNNQIGEAQILFPINK